MVDTRGSWQVKGSAILPELIALMNVTEQEKLLLGDLAAAAKAQSSLMTNDFYARLFKYENTAEYLRDAPMERLHSMVGQWFLELFSGTYDEAYIEKRLGIGQIHVRIGLPVRYPLAMIDVVMPHGEAVARQSSNPTLATQAFRKVLSLDIAIFNQAYEDRQLAHLAELVGGERLARRLLSGSV